MRRDNPLPPPPPAALPTGTAAHLPPCSMDEMYRKSQDDAARSPGRSADARLAHVVRSRGRSPQIEKCKTRAALSSNHVFRARVGIGMFTSTGGLVPRNAASNTPSRPPEQPHTPPACCAGERRMQPTVLGSADARVGHTPPVARSRASPPLIHGKGLVVQAHRLPTKGGTGVLGQMLHEAPWPLEQKGVARQERPYSHLPVHVVHSTPSTPHTGFRSRRRSRRANGQPSRGWAGTQI